MNAIEHFSSIVTLDPVDLNPYFLVAICDSSNWKERKLETIVCDLIGSQKFMSAQAVT